MATSKRGNSSVGRARPCQGRGREFEPRFPLQFARVVESVDTRDLKSLAFRGVPVQVWLRAPFQNHTSGSLAQSVEQRTFNPLVEGSNPSRPTTLNQHLNWCFFMPKIQDKDFPTLFSKKTHKKITALSYGYLSIFLND